jgi:asparagine synthase (glutamine-hydrolysing)
MPWELSDVMAPDMAVAGLAALDPVAHVADAASPLPQSDYLKVSALESVLYMRNQLLRDMDWASMSHGVEVRVPLVDASLAATLATLPLASPALAGKLLLRAAPATSLPVEVVLRPKVGFLTPIESWAQRLDVDLPQSAERRLHGQHWSRRWALTVARLWPDAARPAALPLAS